MKKLLCMVVALMMTMVLLVGCSGGGSGEASTPDEVKGEVFETEKLSVLVPDGWMAFMGPDIFNEYDGESNPTVIQMGKGIEESLGLLQKPAIYIYFNADTPAGDPEVSKPFYENVEDVESFDAAGFTWIGFTGESIGYPSAVLSSQANETDSFNVTMTLENGGDSISIDDADVQAILDSIKILG